MDTQKEEGVGCEEREEEKMGSQATESHVDVLTERVAPPTSRMVRHSWRREDRSGLEEVEVEVEVEGGEGGSGIDRLLIVSTEEKYMKSMKGGQ